MNNDVIAIGSHVTQVLNMELREFIDSFPRNMRMGTRQMIADAHGISEVTVRAWANGTRNHPCNLMAIEITESVTAGKVTRFDLRPDVFGYGEDKRAAPFRGRGISSLGKA